MPRAGEWLCTQAPQAGVYLVFTAGTLLAQQLSKGPMGEFPWFRVSAAIVVCVLLAAAWRWLSDVPLNLDEVAAWLAPHRHAWYALPMVMMTFVVLAVVPVLLLVAATGVVFGPVLGQIYAMAGCLASGSVGFAIGRWLGRRRVEQLGGERVALVTRTLKRNGTLAVFFLRKVPVPFILANIVVGASTVRYRDFLLGTALGMAAIVIALAGFGYQLTMAVRDPSAASVTTALLFVSVPLTLAWLINRALSRPRPA